MKKNVLSSAAILLLLGISYFSSVATAEELTPPTTPSLPTELVGTWVLTQVTCDGDDSNTIPMSSISGTYSSTLYLSTLTSSRYWNYTPAACTQSVPMSAVSASSGNLNFTDGLSICTGSCFTGCSVTGNTNSFPYVLTGSGGTGSTLDVTATSYSPYGNPCVSQSTPIVLHYVKL